MTDLPRDLLDNLILAATFAVVALMFMLLNMNTRPSVVKAVTYWAMWAGLIAMVFFVVSGAAVVVLR